MCRTFLSAPLFCKCATLLQVCRTFPSVLHFFFSTFLPVNCSFKIVTHVLKSAKFSGVWRILSSVPLFSKCGALFQVLRLLPSVSQFSKFAAIFPSAAHFTWCAALFQVSCTFPTVAQCLNGANFCQGRRILPSVQHFSNCGTCFQECQIFLSVAHFRKCAAVFQISACGAFVQVRLIFPYVPQFFQL